MRAPFGFCLFKQKNPTLLRRYGAIMKIRKDTVTGKSNPLITEAASLREKKYRKKYGAFVCDGIKLFGELCLAVADIRVAFVNTESADRILPIIEKCEQDLGREIEVQLVSPSAFCKLTDEKAPEGIVTQVANFHMHSSVCDIASIGSGERCLVLASLRDPGNLGTVARSALAFGVDRLILTSDCADIYSPKTLRAAMGALFKLRVDVTANGAETVRELRKLGRKVYAAELRPGAVSVLEADIKSTDVFVIGNEGSGIPEEISSEADISVYIPIDPRSESLNAAAAAAVLMWQQSIAEVGNE